MSAALAALLDDLALLGYKPIAGVYPNVTPIVTFQSVQKVHLAYDDTQYIPVSVDQATFAEPFPSL
ncbi:MAG TPA: hypothetical protein VE954_24145 [Oligoflexus sp.]|uniref:hypothetical protein n=1 Tax=Oligoflexus sp. TaxID=1971216 RepID=UPI002D67496F|nr:hypothetical protein [Oligoflexus sp.]HYX36206.1 hypothetical protein [Oligoflexus sp.]